MAREAERRPGARGGVPDAHAGGGHVGASVRRGVPAPGGWRDLWQRERALAVARSQERRERILAHPDLAARLTQLPLAYTRPDQWTGYVPPRVWNGTLNTDPRRQALAVICEAALEREGGNCPALDVT